MDKYDMLVESEINHYDEDYAYELDRKAGVETKAKQERLCWNMKNKRYFTDYP
jgi:hypothetical protein